MDELPHRAIIDLQAALAQLGHQTAQREVLLLAPRISQSRAANSFFGLWPPIWPGATLPVRRKRATHSIPCYPDANARPPVAATARLLNRSDHPLAKIH